MTEQLNSINKQNPILLTTAISYTNGKPHIGHLYESVLADFIKNVFIILDHPIKLLTGTDEHGKKIQETALLENTEPITICNKYSSAFKLMNDTIGISYDHFIRTTDLEHKKLVTDSINHSQTISDDIYLSNYEGWYDIKEETYISEIDAKLNNYINPITNKSYERIKEETYMFKLKKYEDLIRQLLVENKNWIVPNSYATEPINRIWSNSTDILFSTTDTSDRIDTTDGLIDISITRTTFDWGIKFPSDKKHIIYVWFDALLNYITGRNILNLNGGDENLETYHLIGKDIVWFHAVIYPAILKSIGEPLPNSILVHGFVLDQNGRKMSKSLGNVVDVEWLSKTYPIEAIRYYLINETVFGSDILFSTTNLTATYNNILLKNFGNLWQRMYNLLRPIESELNKWISNNQLIVSNFKQNILQEVSAFKNKFDFIEYRNIMYRLLDYANRELTEKKPWTLIDSNIETKISIFADIFINFNCACCLMYAIIPSKILELVKYFNWTIEQLKLSNEKINFTYTSDEKKIIAFTKLD